MAPAPTVVIPSPHGPPAVNANSVAAGLPVPPIDRIKLMDSIAWEEFILEWVDSLRTEYGRVERCGGAGDMGRDIIGMAAGGQGVWDNFQAKHYANPLAPSDICIELGKLAYYTFTGEYTYPRRYSFVAPQGAGTKLSNLLKKPDQLREELYRHWDTRCRLKITSLRPVELDVKLRAYIDQLDFSIFDAIPPLKIIDGHSNTRWHVARFGGGLPERPPVATPPSQPASSESRFIRELFLAYAEHVKAPVNAPADLAAHGHLAGHFDDARREFYSAESLRAFSRDTLPPGHFESLQDEIHAGIMDDWRALHPDGYQRVLAVVRTARLLPLAAHPLFGRMSTRDRGGVCHQLANAGKIWWVNDGR